MDMEIPPKGMVLIPEIGVPFAPDVDYQDLRVRAQAACNTALALEPYGLDIDDTEEDRQVAAIVTSAYAADPTGVSETINNKRMVEMRPAALVRVSQLLGEFGRLVVQDSIQIRNMVVNKLVLETDHDDARIRLRALELLGKVSDVGLFTEKRELTVKHTTTDELRASLKSKLHGLINSDSAEVAEYEVVSEGDDA